MSLAFTIADLRQCPEFFDAVADRIWQAWWKPHGHPLDYIRGRLRENMEPTALPLALVAHEDGNFLGSVSGGCVEGEVVTEALDVIEAGKPKMLEFGVADETAWRAGLSCGGRIAVYVEKVD